MSAVSDLSQQEHTQEKMCCMREVTKFGGVPKKENWAHLLTGILQLAFLPATCFFSLCQLEPELFQCAFFIFSWPVDLSVITDSQKHVKSCKNI